MAHPTRFERVAFAFGGQQFDTEALGRLRRSSLPDFAALDPPWRAVFHLETAAKLLISLEAIFGIFSKCTLKSLNNQTDFDSGILRSVKPNVTTETQYLAVGFACSFGSPAFGKARFLGDQDLVPVHA
jgi:hypothetical protein